MVRAQILFIWVSEADTAHPGSPFAVVGNNGIGYGSGGSGGTSVGAINTTRAGGTGAPGLIIIEEFY